MAIIDCPFWLVRRQLKGADGGSHRGATTLRMRPASCNSTRPRQVRSRALWSQASWAWLNLLTSENRQDWRDAADDMTWRDYLTQYKKLDGHQWFVGLAARCLLAGWAINVETAWVWWGQTLDEVSFEFLSSSRIRVSWSPAFDEYDRLALFGSGPLGQGVSRGWEVPDWDVASTPRHWRWLGSSEPAAAGPLEYDLPFVVEPGLKLVVLAGGVSDSGMYPLEWRTAEVIAA